MPTFYLPPQPPIRPPAVDVNDLAGADVAFTNGMTIEGGDWKCVTADDAAVQSVRRETCANVGAAANRPEWGVGLTEQLFRNATRPNLDALESRSRDRARQNPRVGRVVDIRTQRLTGTQGSALVIEFIPVGRDKARQVVLKAKR